MIQPEDRGRAGREAAAAAARVRSLAGLVALAAFVLWAAFVSGAVRAGTEPSRADPPPGAVTGGDPDAGRALFLATCAACHGAAAQGTDDAPSLGHAGTALVDFMIRTGRMPLPELGQPVRRGAQVLRDDQIADILAYLAPLMDGPAIPEVATTGAELGRGRARFTANCAACHGATGNGAAIGGGIVAPGLGRSSPLDVGEAVVGGPGTMPRFSFAPDDLDALAAYVQYLRDPPSPGGSAVASLGPVAEGFIAGAIGLVALLLVVGWVGRSDRLAQRFPAPSKEQPFSEGNDE